MKSLLMRQATAWGTVVLFLIFGTSLLAYTSSSLLLGLQFAWVLGVIVWASFGVVHEAEEVADMLGEPYGTLVLTLSIVIIEVALIAAVMLGPTPQPTLGRDTMFAVLMIVLNGVVGLGLLVGGLKHMEQEYNLQGAGAYLVILLPLAMLTLVLPNFTSSSVGGSLSSVQAVLLSCFTIILYLTFLVLQTGRHNEFFIEPTLNGATNNGCGECFDSEISASAKASELAVEQPEQLPAQTTEQTPEQTNRALQKKKLGKHIFLLLMHIFPIVILSKTLGAMLGTGLLRLNAPPELGGIIIAMVVFTPEGIAAFRAATANELQRTINLCLGAATSTMGLTVPVVLLIGVITDHPVLLGLSSINMVILSLTLFLSTLTFSGKATTMLEGAVHLIMFFIFLLLVFFP